MSEFAFFILAVANMYAVWKLSRPVINIYICDDDDCDDDDHWDHGPIEGEDWKNEPGEDWKNGPMDGE